MSRANGSRSVRRRFASHQIKQPGRRGDKPTLICARSPVHAGKVRRGRRRELFINLDPTRQISSKLIDWLFVDFS